MASNIDDHSFLFGGNVAFIEEVYGRYLRDPNSVEPEWAAFFAGLQDDVTEALKEIEGASWAPRAARARPAEIEEAAPDTATAVGEDVVRGAVLDSIRALMLIRAYRVRGHLEADLDPLGLEQNGSHPELDPASYGFTEADYDRDIFIDYVLGLEHATLREIIDVVRNTYCGKIGVEFMHIQSPDEKAWIQQEVESGRARARLDPEERLGTLRHLIRAEEFEKFLHVKYPGTKRFGVDGAEAMVTALEEIIHSASRQGVEEIIFGMPHRGRLNVLANIMGKPYTAIFSEFQGSSAHPEDVQGSGDVKYHLGTSGDREFEGHDLHLSLNANPSHLEAVDPVVVGKVRAKQAQRGDGERNTVMGILMHGDAAFAGQGLVAETFTFSELKGYRSGGTVHLIVNNQIGFTTSPGYSRSSPYPSDLAKAVQAPIFHVNGDDPEAVVHVARIATEYRIKFRKDVVIDMFCYRRFGHNESDEPSFTQPLMYRKIAEHPTVVDIYASRLVEDGTLTRDQVDAELAAFRERLEGDFEASKTFKPNKADWLEGAWTGFEVASGDKRRGDTAVSLKTLKEVGKALTTVPEDVKIHPRIARQLQNKAKMFETGEGIDWATAEALAFGTLLKEGSPVRLSGQDSGRGTFSQRHAVLVDQDTEERYIPLANVDPEQAMFEVIDSPLSEASVLGFEYGYSITDPDSLVLWEAQFGDFANGAQVIIDQFISSGEAKWLRMSGLVMLLPHGYEGQGPEHSSARLERYLQICGEDNWQVVNCTTPANYFHVLRRQLRRNFRKPLVVMTPKSLLRHKMCVSTLKQMAPGTHFHRVMPEAEKLVADAKVRRVVLCSGKVYYDLLAERRERGIDDIAIVRLEQLYPFPVNALAAELTRYPNADVVWCQEEPWNMGAWSYVDRRIEELLSGLDVSASRPGYAGRAESAATATGLLRRHNREQAALVDEALTIEGDAGRQAARAGARGPAKKRGRGKSAEPASKPGSAKKQGKAASARKAASKTGSTRAKTKVK
ncbi:MAG: 2-oxoglutarate dehydrogenase E1 component [Alphaproteobacteria bacterium]|nr:2-oxoglutarate dehydrogenase E1 component [Alphaproteobacteria bacterium]